LTNVIYTGAIRHKGQQYPGEHGAIVDIGTWKRVQALLKHPSAFAAGRAGNKHNALLNGLLYCEVCCTRMVYSYSGKDRKYPYYVCLNAQRKGWAVCPAKSLPARNIEDSVLAQVHAKQLTTVEWEQLDSVQRVAAIQRIIKRVCFDGTTRQVSIRFHPIPETGDRP